MSTENPMVGETGQITARTLTITPELAKEWLDSYNTGNYRNYSKRTAEKITEAIKRGEWMLNGEPIIFDRMGVLADGQHRLGAICDADIPVQALVVWGVEPASRDTIDMGKSRTLGDLLFSRGYADRAVLGATLSLIHRYENGKVKDLSGRAAPSRAESLVLLEKHPDVVDAIHFASKLSLQIQITKSWGAFCYFVFSHIDAHDADVFFTRLVSGVGSREGDPITALRNELAKPRPYRHRPRNLHLEIGAKTFKAWNAFRSGQTITQFHWRPGGRVAEKFPEAI